VALSYVQGGVHKLKLGKSNSDMRYFIPNMDTVYKNALLTIVALSGETSDSGLAGVRSGSRFREEIPFMIKETSIIASLDPVRNDCDTSDASYIADNPWDHRGWTFQEKIFSSRALIFAAEQIYWECQKSSWCEEGIWEVPKPRRVYNRAFDDTRFLLPQSADPHSFVKAYESLVQKYTRRQLSFQSDALDAFGGVLHTLEITWNQTFFWGMPCSNFSSALQWSIDKTYKANTVPKRRSVPVPFKADDGALTSLPIPSWAWAGWNNKVQMPLAGDLGEAIEVKFYRLTSSLEVVEISELTDKTSSDEHTLRHIWKKPHEAIVERKRLPEDILNHPFRLTFLCFWSSSAWVQCDWFMGPSGGLFPNLGWGSKMFNCSWNQLPPKPPMPDTEGRKLRPGDKVYPGLAECVVIGRDVGISVGGCDDMLLLIVIERDKNYPIIYRCGAVSVAEDEWVELEHHWNLFILG
jgi:hypothetical protein